MIDTPPMLPALRQFVDWVAGYTLSPPGEVMAMALRVVAPGLGAPATGWRRRRSAARGAASPRRGARCWTRWPNGSRARTGELARAAGVGAGVVRGMADAGLLVPAVLPIEPPFAIPDPEHPGQILAPDQEAAAAALRAGGGGARLLRHAAGRRDRVGQDRGLSRGGGRMPAPGPPGAGAAAGDRAVLAVAGALRAPLRRGARRCGIRT